ncbi:MAG: dITP/XTP pyrophosphatase [Anaerolineae bacterium]|nr:dITP/XTP pyrophosphatase [Anaerolineae bacterium]MDL1896642.1 RdgB/HAM1 family non-canonical purine NTP pyrophosphatase [Anaerolineae bacterium CFX7]
MQRLLIATHNRGKVSEYAEILDGLPFELVTLDELGIRDDVQETGATLQENARLKALTYSAQSGLLALADDSGLEVDALGGAPGVYSKRYAGKGKSDADRNVYLLEKLSAVPRAERAARFRCVIVIADAQGHTWTSEGTCEGEIAFTARGTNGFGYDPIFIVRGDDRHLAEFSPQEKNAISHRGRAAVGARKILAQLAN